MAGLEEYYRILDLEPGATLSEIKQAYREQAKTWHPDRFPYDHFTRKRCEERMRRINEAYEHLRRFAAEAKPRPAPAPEPGPPPKPGPPPFRQSPPPPEPEAAAEEPEPWMQPWDEASAPKPPPKPSWEPFRRHVPIDQPDYAGVTQVGVAFAAASLILAGVYLPDVWSRENYYTAVRLTVSLGCGYGVYFSLSRNYWEIALALGLIAMVLNPIAPVLMSLEEWRVFSALCPLMLGFFWAVLLSRESRKGR